MRVCLIGQLSIGMVSGGPLTQIRETARYLPEFGVEVSWFDQWNGIERDEVDLAHLFGANALTHDIAMRLHHFSIPYVVSSIFFTNRSPALVRRSLQVSRYLERLATGIRTEYDFTAEVCRASRLVLPNTAAEGTIIEEGMSVPSEQIVVIPNGVDPRFAEATPDLFVKEYGLKDFVLNVGHIGSGRKNVLRLMQGMRGIDRDLVVIGKVHEGAYAEACREEARKNRRITIIEGLPNDSPLLASAYAAASLFALPSKFETPGIAALEAALAGAAIVITPHGGTKEYFGDDAIYVDPESVDSIAEGIRRGLAAPVDGRLRERILHSYTWREVARQTAEAYHQAIP